MSRRGDESVTFHLNFKLPIRIFTGKQSGKIIRNFFLDFFLPPIIPEFPLNFYRKAKQKSYSKFFPGFSWIVFYLIPPNLLQNFTEKKPLKLFGFFPGFSRIFSRISSEFLQVKKMELFFRIFSRFFPKFHLKFPRFYYPPLFLFSRNFTKFYRNSFALIFS